MNSIIGKYIGKKVTEGIIGFTVVLAALATFILIIREMKFVGKGDYDVLLALQYILCTMPRRLYEFIPWAMLIGTLIGLGTLSTNNETIIMRGAGISIKQIAFYTLRHSLVIILIVTFIGEIICPNLESWGYKRKTIAISGGQSMVASHGQWFRVKDTFLHVEKVGANKVLHKITRYKFEPSGRLSKISVIDKAEYIGNHWNLYGIKGTMLWDSSTEVISENFAVEKKLIDIDIVNSTLVLNHDIISISKLIKIIKLRAQNNLDITFYSNILWQKLLKPLKSLSMVLLALPWVFATRRSNNQGSRIVLGLILGFVVHIVDAVILNFALINNFEPRIAAFIPLILFFILGIFLLNRINNKIEI